MRKITMFVIMFVMMSVLVACSGRVAAAPLCNVSAPHPFAIALSEFFKDSIPPDLSVDSIIRPWTNSTWAAFVDLDGNGTHGVFAIRLGIPGFTGFPIPYGRIFYMYDGELFYRDTCTQNASMFITSMTAEGRWIFNLDTDGFLRRYTLFGMEGGRLIETMAIHHSTLTDNFYRFYGEPPIGWDAWEFSESITEDEFNTLRAHYGLDNILFSWEADDETDEILAMTISVAASLEPCLKRVLLEQSGINAYGFQAAVDFLRDFDSIFTDFDPAGFDWTDDELVDAVPWIYSLRWIGEYTGQAWAQHYYAATFDLYDFDKDGIPEILVHFNTTFEEGYVAFSHLYKYADGEYRRLEIRSFENGTEAYAHLTVAHDFFRDEDGRIITFVWLPEPHAFAS